MKTTKEGFLMNTLRRIPRHMVKALAAGAVLIAATLPLAVASTAGAATVPIVNFVTNANSFAGMVTGTSSVSISGATTLVVTSAGSATNLAGYGLEDTTGGAGFLATVTSDVVTGAGPRVHTLVISTSNFCDGRGCD